MADVAEANQYLKLPTLGKRSLERCEVLTETKNFDVRHLLGEPDDLKLKFSITLFSQCNTSDEVFQRVLEKFFASKTDQVTLSFLNTR